MKTKVPVFSLEGKKIGDIELPEQFSSPLRIDVLQRAALASMAAARQPYGTDPLAGLRTTAKMKTLRRAYGTWTGKGIARLSRIRWGSGHMTGVVRKTPHAVKGRHATPPHAERVWEQKINEKERLLAIRAGIAATAVKKLVTERGHRIKVELLPLVFENALEGTKKAKEVQNALEKIGLKEELERCSIKRIRAGKGKMRGRKYKSATGPLIVVAEDKGIIKTASNIPGIDVTLVKNLNAALLAPGTKAGRLAVFTKAALEKMENEKLFL